MLYFNFILTFVLDCCVLWQIKKNKKEKEREEED